MKLKYEKNETTLDRVCFNNRAFREYGNTGIINLYKEIKYALQKSEIFYTVYGNALLKITQLRNFFFKMR